MATIIPSLLSKSSLKKRLLAIFFTNPEAELYVREAAARINADPTNVSRELRKLEEEGLFFSKSRGKQKYFRLNKNYPLYGEFKSMIMKTVGVQGSLETLVKGVPGVRRAFIYGSFARNTERAGSDIDLCLIVRKNEFKESSLLEGLHRLERALGREINYTFLTEEEWKSKQRLKDSFIMKLLANKRIELVNGN